MLTIRLDAAESLVDQIARGIRVLLASGTLKPNDELPTVRQLAGDLGVNLNTVSRAYRELEEAGLVTSVRGRGTVVASNQELLRGGKARKKREFDGSARFDLRRRQTRRPVRCGSGQFGCRTAREVSCLAATAQRSV